MKRKLSLLVVLFAVIVLIVISGLLAYREWGPTDQEAAVTDVYNWRTAGVNKVVYPKTCNYFVAPNGNNNNNGTSLNTPWRDIHYATATSPGGVVICIRGGTYNYGYLAGRITMSKGSQRLTNYQNEEVILQGPGLNTNLKQDDKAQIQILSSNNIVENLVFKNFPNRLINITNNNGDTNGNIIRNNQMTGMGRGGIILNRISATNKTESNKFLNNILEYCNANVSGDQIYPGGGQGGNDCALMTIKSTKLSTASGTATLVEGNVFSKTKGHGLMSDPNWGEARGLVIRKNLFRDTNPFIHAADDVVIDQNVFLNLSPKFHRGFCVNLSGGESGDINNIKNNNPGNPAEHAISSDHRITNNVMFGCNQGVKLAITHPDGKLRNVLIKGNTVISTGTKYLPATSCNKYNCAAVAIGLGWPGTAKDPATPVNYDQAFVNSFIEDNIIYKAGNFGGSMFGVQARAGSTMNDTRPPVGLTFRNNIWSEIPGSGFTGVTAVNPRLVGVPNGGAFSNINENTAAMQIIDMVKLMPNSPAINTARDNSLTRDVFDNLRPFGNKNDIGAIEFGGVFISNTPPAATPTAPTGNVCGRADVNRDNIFTLVDFAEFAKMYSNGTKTCADKDVDYGVCGGRDVNKDGKLNIADFGSEKIGFAQRYFPKMNCAL